MKLAGLILVLLLLLSTFASPTLAQTSLTLNERIHAQERIERVYYNHRIWPESNHGPKPLFEQMVPRSLIEQKVIDSLKKSAAVQDYWKRPITADMLQAEMDRMARNTRDSKMLQELFSALDNDPFLVAETLGRQTLADRLVRNWYAFDKRFHSDTKLLARSIQKEAQKKGLQSLQGDHAAITIELASESNTSRKQPNRFLVSKEEFGELKRRYPELNRIYFKEDSDAYVMTQVTNQTENQVDLEMLTIRKKSFSQWWEETSRGIPLRSRNAMWSSKIQTYRLPSIHAGSDCEGWEDVGNLNGLPVNRYDHTAVWTGNEMIIWGGYHGSYLNSGGRYNPATDTWTQTSTGANVPFPRQAHTAIWTGSEMIIWGGSSGFSLDSGARYDPISDSWTSINSASAPSARYFHTAVWTGTAMIVWGGFVDNTLITTNTGAIYSPGNDSWQPTSAVNTPAARSYHTAIWTGTEMLIWGGVDVKINPLGDGGRYNPQSDFWTPISQSDGSPSPRRFHTAVWTGSEMIIWGGQCPAVSCPDYYLNDGALYDPLTDIWTPTSTTMPVPGKRGQHTAIWTGNEMIVWGGYEEGSGYVNTGASYEPGADAWLPIASTGPEERYKHTAIWTGTEMIVWGGLNNYEIFQDGGRYSPSSDTWVEIESGNNAPSERTDHTAVWTGTEMIIWGGRIPYVNVNTGGIYDLALNDWTPTSTGANVPDPRSSHTAIWTGTEMIIWGGNDEDESFNTGGRYNPTGDTWLATSVGVNVPEERTNHTAVWTGSEMIVWGSQWTNTGGRYDPSTDSWQPTSTGPNAPGGRERHTAVWTGQEMIVWGGGDTFGDNSGGRYDPTSDTWTPTSFVDAPTGRFDHTAVWTGSEMIVWGGDNKLYVYPFFTGGRYDPITDTWQPTSVDPRVPLRRSLHSAVWTGSEMIIWGGDIYYGGSINHGGRYTPTTDTWLATTVSSNTPIGRGSHTAVWTGTKMIVWGGGFSFGHNSGGIYSPDQETIIVNPPALPNAEVNIPYSQTISAVGGTAPYEFFLVDGLLPCGLSLDSNTGVISGTPISCEDGGAFTVTTTDANGCAGSEYYFLIVCPLITFLPSTLPDGEVGVSYNQTITPSGGLAPYLFSITAGALPAGLTLDPSTGLISGIPTTVETATFTITAVDIVTCAKSKDYTVNVTGPCLLCDDFEDGVEDPNWTEVKPAWNEAGGFLVGTPNRNKAIIIASPIFNGCQSCSEESAMMTAGGTGNKVSMLGWYVDKANTMELQLKEENDKIVLKQRVNGSIVAKAKATFTIVPNTAYIVKVSYDGTIFTVSVNGSQLFTLIPAAPVPIGTIGFQVKRTTGSFGYITVN